MARPHSRQLSLELTPRFHWGGARAGAGRPRGQRPRAWHRRREAFAARFPSHVTLRVRGDVPSLRTVRFVRAFERSLRTLSAAPRAGEFRVVAYSLLDDHAHLVVEAKDRAALARGMKAVGIRLAWLVRKLFDQTGAVLDGRYHHRVLRTPREVRHALAYVLLNARKHLAQSIARRTRGAGSARALPAGAIDPASSGRWFDGWMRRVPEASESSPVAAARTWLLAVGWRRHRRIDWSEVPGRASARGFAMGRLAEFGAR